MGERRRTPRPRSGFGDQGSDRYRSRRDPDDYKSRIATSSRAWQEDCCDSCRNSFHVERNERHSTHLLWRSRRSQQDYRTATSRSPEPHPNRIGPRPAPTISESLRIVNASSAERDICSASEPRSRAATRSQRQAHGLAAQRHTSNLVHISVLNGASRTLAQWTTERTTVQQLRLVCGSMCRNLRPGLVQVDRCRPTRYGFRSPPIVAAAAAATEEPDAIARKRRLCQPRVLPGQSMPRSTVSPLRAPRAQRVRQNSLRTKGFQLSMRFVSKAQQCGEYSLRSQSVSVQRRFSR
jgi:hypothetical protein